MALFTDADIVTLDDLLRFEATLVQVASSHAINVETKIHVAIDSIGQRLMLWLLNVGASDPQTINRRVIGLSTIVVTAPLKRWLCLESLSRFFAEAYDLQLNTRFQAKWTEYQSASGDASQMCFMAGLGIVYNALPKPAMPLVSVQDGSIGIESMFIRTAWADNHGNESALSRVNAVLSNTPSTVVVGMAEGALKAPPSAAGWNVYASTTAAGFTRQNVDPIPIGATWQLPDSGLIDGPEPKDGQQPSYYVALSREIQRG